MKPNACTSTGRSRLRLLILAVLVVAAGAFAKPAYATAYKSCRAYGVKVSVGGATFASQQYQVSGRYTYKIKMTKSGKKKTVASDVGASFVTNGRYLYYSKYLSGPDANYKNKVALYRMDLNTNKRKKLATGMQLEAMGCSGTYLYYGTSNFDAGVNLYAMNVSTLKKRHMVNYVGTVQYGNGHVVTTTNTGAIGNCPIYSFKADGTGKVKIAKACMASIKGKYVYYTVYKMGANYQSLFKRYRSTFDGKSKKAITGWVTYENLPK